MINKHNPSSRMSSPTSMLGGGLAVAASGRTQGPGQPTLEGKEGEGLLPYAMRLAALAASSRPLGPPGAPAVSGWRR